MAKIIISSGEGYAVVGVVGITKKASEWRGIDDVDAYLSEIARNAEEEYQQNRQEIIKGLCLVERLMFRLFGYLPKVNGCKSHDEWKGLTDWRNEHARDYLIGDETRYLLEETGEIIPLGRLELLCVEPVIGEDVDRFEDGLFNYGYKCILERAVKAGDGKGVPYVALADNMDNWLAPEVGLLSRRVPHTRATAQLYAEKKSD